jgi:hypothetical protein
VSFAFCCFCKPLEHPALLQYLTKLGIDHDIARQYLSQVDFKAPQSPWGYFALGHPTREVLRHLTRCLGCLFQLNAEWHVSKNNPLISNGFFGRLNSETLLFCEMVKSLLSNS